MDVMVPLEGIEPPLPVPKTGALSIKLQGQAKRLYSTFFQ